jgi:hypothetical protein
MQSRTRLRKRVRAPFVIFQRVRVFSVLKTIQPDSA